MLQSMQELRTRRRREDGFTLIELLVVVVIIGILIAIAIPVYLNYQKGAANKSAQSDTRNAIAVIEQCYADSANKYPTAIAAVTGQNAYTTTGCTNGRLNTSPGNTMTYSVSGGTYTVGTVAGDPGDKKFTYTSNNGQTVEAAKA